MLTERAPRNPALRAEFLKSDSLASLSVPPDDRLRELAKSMISALKEGTTTGVHAACAGFLGVAADFYEVEEAGNPGPRRPPAARPRGRLGLGVIWRLCFRNLADPGLDAHGYPQASDFFRNSLEHSLP